MGVLMYIDSPVGPITLGEDNGALTYLLFGHVELPGYVPGAGAIVEAARAQLGEYFSGTRREFQLPLEPSGTPFQERVWAALRTIPYGETRTYKQLAELAGCPKGFRAVGMANHNNPISIIIPCHRVIGADGSLTGYGGGMDAKRWLLELERSR